MTVVGLILKSRRWTWLGRWARDTRGAAVVEFGLLAPVLAVVVLGIISGATLLIRYNAMHSGLSSAAQYVMRGGTDLTTIENLGRSAWAGRTNQSSITATKICRCGASAGDCSTLCPDESVPQAFITITGRDTVNGVQIVTARQDVRIR